MARFLPLLLPAQSLSTLFTPRALSSLILFSFLNTTGFSLQTFTYCSPDPEHRAQPPLTACSPANFYSSFRCQLKHCSFKCASLTWDGGWTPLLSAPTIPFPSVSNTRHAFLCLIIYTCLTLHHHPSAPLPYKHTRVHACTHMHVRP